MKDQCGIIMAGGNGTRLYPLTRTINKHLLPVYDKPMIYYSLSTLMLSGIRRIAIITRPVDVELFEKLLGTGENLGISITYIPQNEANGVPEGYVLGESFIGEDNVAMILGDNIFIGQGLGVTLRQALQNNGAHIFAFPVNNPQDYGVLTLDESGTNVISIVEKPDNSESNLAIPGLYFTSNDVVDYAKGLSPSKRGETEITDLLRIYQEQSKLTVTTFRRGIGWMDAGSVEALYAASELVEILQKRQGLRFSSPEEIAWRNQWITDSDLMRIANSQKGTKYSKYLTDLVAK